MSNDNEQTLMRVMSGEDKSVKAGCIRAVTFGVSLIYSLIMGVRNWMYDVGVKKTHEAGVPVISVGNLTTGGTGKTPVVTELVGELLKMGLRVGILMRGYKSEETGGSDEAKLYEAAFGSDGGKVVVEVNADRVVGAERLGGKVDVIVLDDGFQHRRLGRALDIVLVDATNPFGYGYVLPRGLLRERRKGLRRAGGVIITRGDQVGADELKWLKEELEAIRSEGVGSGVGVDGVCNHVWDGFMNERDAKVAVRGERVFAFCGIGNPGAFFGQVKGVCELEGTRAFADHHAYTMEDVKALREQAERLGVKTFVTTEKDWVKLREVLGEGEESGGFVYCRPKLGVRWSEGKARVLGLLEDVTNSASKA